MTQTDPTATVPPAPDQKHIVVFSSGRSGSNLLLDILDQHEATNGRNEINATDPNFMALPQRAIEPDMPANFTTLWDQAVAHAKLRKGSRDRLDLSFKSFAHGKRSEAWSWLAKRTKLRRLALPAAQLHDFPISRLVLTPNAASEVVPVFKFAENPAWYPPLLDSGRNLYIVHNLRDPRKMLQSWFNRFIGKRNHDPARIYERNRQKLAVVLGRDGHDPLPQDYALPQLLRSEVLLWRYNNEPLIEALEGNARYRLSRYEDMSSDLLSVARTVYDFAGLDLSAGTATRVQSITNTLFSAPHKTQLDPKDLDRAVQEALEGSLLAKFYA